MEGKKAFDDEKNFTERGVGICSKIYDAEWDLFMKFCDFNKKGDDALAIPDCPLAKKMYESALALIPGEFYPIQQLAKIPDCLAKEENKKKDEEQKKLAKQKEAEERAKREAEEKAKKEAERAEKERLAKEKEEQDKLARQKEAEERKRKMAEEEERIKAEKERLAKEKEESEKAKKEAETKTAQQNIENVPGEPNEDPDPKKGKGKTTTYQILGSQENYRKNLARANDLFKTKRYEEAKTAYEECLKFKPDDPLSKLRIRQCDSILQLKK
jgi:flagellar biosynthesis GTPase FlhF